MKFFRLAFVLTLLGMLTASCDTYQPSQLCGAQTEPDHRLFSDYFSELQLVNLSSKDTNGEDQRIGRVFEVPASLSLNGTLIKAGDIRLCIFGAKIRGEVVFDETFSITGGTQLFELGKFEEGPYIIRVYADGKLVENISFVIE
jgi:hypothetical protein